MSGSIAPRPGGTTRSVGAYDLTCEVTRGVLGTLWVGKAADATRAPPAALIRRIQAPSGGEKVLDRLVEGAEWGRRGREPGLIAIADIVREQDEVAVVCPFVEGEPLRALLRAAAFKREFFGTDVALRMLVEVLEQLELVHDRTKYDPMHRAFGGLQPDSIFVGTDGFVRLLDIGVGVAASQSSLYDGESQWIAYQSPEQVSGGEATAASDVFAVGAMLWEMLANRRLFAGATPVSVKDRVKSGPIQRIDEVRGAGMPHVDAALGSVIAKSLERDPAMRFQSAAEMSDALRGAGKLAAASGVGAIVERLAEQFLDKRRALLDKVGIARTALDGRIAFFERAAAPRPQPGAAEPAPTGGSGALAALARSSSAHTPPPPPSMRASMPPQPPSMRSQVPGAAAAAGSSRADRALALAKVASVAAAAAPQRSAPPASLTPSPPAVSEPSRQPSTPAPPLATAPAAPAPAAPKPVSTASAGAIAPTPTVTVSAPPSAAAAPVVAAAPAAPPPRAAEPPADAPAPAAPADEAPPAPAVERPPEPPAVSAPAAIAPAVAAAPPTPSPAVEPAREEAVALNALGPAIGNSVANGISPVVSSIAVPGTGDDDDVDVPFARKSGGNKRLWIGAAAAVTVLGIGLAVATSGSGTDSPPAAPQAAAAPTPLPKPESKAEPEPAPAAPPPQATAEPAPEPKAEEAKPEPPKSDEPEEDAKPSKKRKARAARTATKSAPKVKRAAGATAPAPPPAEVGAAFKPGGI